MNSKHYHFPYSNIADIKIPVNIETTIYSVAEIKEISLSCSEIVKKSLKIPIGAPKLCEILNGDEKILLVVDDISRPTPIRDFIDEILSDLKTSGIDDSQIEILIALGTHRFMTKDEFEIKLGINVVNRFRVFNHEWNNPEELYDYGKISDGTSVVLNKAMHNSDFIIGIGSIAPHPAAGFSGGGKIIVPGVATDEAAGNFHWESVQSPQKDVLGIRDTSMRKKIDEIAQKAGLNYIVNVILDGRNQVVDAVSGDPVLAHKIGSNKSLEIFGVEIDHPDDYDIFIIDTHPLDQDLWQGVKALCALECIVPDGAICIIVSPLPEGICNSHPEIMEYGFQPIESVKPLIKTGKISKIVGHNIVQGGRLLQRTTAYLVSPGVVQEDAEKMGFTYFADPQEALMNAIRLKTNSLKRPPKLMIIRMGGEIAPITKSN